MQQTSPPWGRTMTRVVIVCGAGGVGKTTTSAALAVRLAESGQRVAVLTIDPARRLADALGVEALGNIASAVPVAGGSLDALMLDAKETFDEIVRKNAPSPDVRDRILKNHYYRFVSSRLPGVHEYMAMERLLELTDSNRYDVVVLDTPPTRHALDFLSAPDRMAGLMDEGVMRWLVLPASAGGWRMIEMGSDMLAGVLKRLLGERTIEDIAEFFSGFQSLWAGFRERSLAARALLASSQTRFVLVTTPAPGARGDALAFLEVLRRDSFPFAGFLVNRCAPVVTQVPNWPDAPKGVSDQAWSALYQSIYSTITRRNLLAGSQDAAIADLRMHAPAGAKVWRLPEAEDEIRSLAGLRSLGAALPSDIVD